MRTIFEACEPRPEVLTGELREEIFAARLRDVVEGKAELVYQDPSVFFENTYPTEGLRLLLGEALGRLTGINPANNAIIRLETAFGGGKTHNLIALYHAARGYPASFIDKSLVPLPNSISIAGVVGSDSDPSNGLDHYDGVITYTLWGEIAYQLGGADGYVYVQQSDHERSAPGTAVLEKLIGDAPTLIMIDEVARHLRAAKSVPTATGRSDLAEQTIAFLMSLLEFAASKQQVVVVFTLADPSDAFGKETEELTQELAEVKRISARQERIITPTAETELAAIVTHRLFRTIDCSVATEVASVYGNAYHRCVDHGMNIPQRALRAEYAEEISSYYPFHPELLNTLNRKTSTIPNFQRTRGALRLLAMVIRELWTSQPDSVYLIHSHDINLAVEDIANDLTSRLERPRFRQVIEADIVSPLEGSPAHAQSLDYYAETPYTQRVATAAFLHSLTQGIASGVDPADLVLATVTPDDDPALLLKAANQLVEKGWFFEYDGHRYRFKTEPSINKIINDEMGMVGVGNSKSELNRRIRHIWKKGYFVPVFFPSEPGDVGDDAEAPKLVVVHYDAAVTHAEAEYPPELVARIFDYAGAQEGYRRFRNNLVFLVADQEQVENMVEQVRRYLAIQRIISDADRMSEFFPEQRSQLKKRAETAELDVRVAITRAYRWLYYPSAEAPESRSHLARVQLAPQEQGDVAPDQSTVVLNVLKDLDKVITQESNVLSGKFAREKAWDAGQTSITTEDLRRAFARKMNLRMLLDINQLKKTIRNGIEQGVWVYYDAHEQMGYNHQSPAPAIQISDETTLYAPEKYAELGWPIKGVEPIQPPLPPPPGTGGTGGVIISPSPVQLQGEGAPGQAFQMLRDACGDKEIGWLRRIHIEIQGNGPHGANEVRALGLSIPQLGKAEFWIKQRLSAEFGNGEQLIVDFEGGWDRYKRLKQVTDSFGQEAQKFHAETHLRMDFPDGLDVHGGQFQTIVDVFTQLGFGHLTVGAEPLEESE